jgi:bifunctional ADP-heptose synthase (sugar kinase/adenylyltransferase)
MKILVFGESCKDVFHYGDCSRLCPDAPVPVFKLINTVETWGMAKNVERNLVSLGARVDLITNATKESITKTRYMDNRTNHMFLRVDENDNSYGSLTLEQLQAINFEDYDAVIVSDYNKGYMSEEVLQAISVMHHTTFIDTKRLLSDWAEGFSFIKLNHKEYENNRDNFTDTLKQKVILTKGQYGSEFQNNIYSVPTVEVKDTSGAGDTFVSGLCFEYVITKDIVDAIKFANQCATKVVQKRGVSIV